MKLFFVFYLLFLSSNATAWTGYWERATRGPLRQIVFYGYYYAEDEKEFEKSEEYYRRRGYLEEGESFKESSLYGGEGKERYGGGGRYYCHKETDPEDEGYTVIFNPNLRARLYDEEWNLLTEDYLRSFQPETDIPFKWRVRSYVPYHPEAYYLRVVRLVEDKEVAVLLEKRVGNLERLKSRGSSYWYDKYLGCYRIYHI